MKGKTIKKILVQLKLRKKTNNTSSFLALQHRRQKATAKINNYIYSPNKFKHKSNIIIKIHNFLSDPEIDFEACEGRRRDGVTIIKTCYVLLFAYRHRRTRVHNIFYRL